MAKVNAKHNYGCDVHRVPKTRLRDAQVVASAAIAKGSRRAKGARDIQLGFMPKQARADPQIDDVLRILQSFRTNAHVDSETEEDIANIRCTPQLEKVTGQTKRK